MAAIEVIAKQELPVPEKDALQDKLRAFKQSPATRNCSQLKYCQSMEALLELHHNRLYGLASREAQMSKFTR